MEVIRGLENFPRIHGPVVLALGTFDGVHLGHRALLDLAAAWAHALGGHCTALTFDPHPLQVIAPPKEPFLLTTLAERLALLADSEVDAAVVVPFDAQLRQLAPEQWVQWLVARTGLSDAVCGPNYTYGRNRGGTAATLAAAGAALGFTVHLAPTVEVGGTPVSSTLIRGLIRSGEVRQAARQLGRWYQVEGPVARGDRRGTALGFPTANLRPAGEKVTPARGIYAAFVRTNTATHQAAVSVGTRPTFGAGELMIEAHLLDVQADLYDQTLAIAFVQRLRDEEVFPSAEALVIQMREDVVQVRRVLAQTEAPTMFT